MNVLSLFDGMSCGQQALERAGINVEKYFASEVDKYAIQVTMNNYPNTIQLGDVRHINASDLPKIDMLIGGSPCQSFSFAGKRKGMATKDEQEILSLEQYLNLKEQEFEFEGQSYLFWEYVRLLKELKPKYFLLENVQMVEQWENVISKTLGVRPLKINSALLSAQNRVRLYWTNIGMYPAGLFGDLESIIRQPQDRKIFLKDILEEEVDEKYFLSDKMINYLLENDKKQKIRNNGFKFSPTEGDKKASSITTKSGQRMDDNFIICHNFQKRSPDRPSLQKNPKAGGSGHLSRNDGKSYCLNTCNGQALEIILGADYRSDEGLRPRKDGKTPTLMARARQDVYGVPMVLSNKIRKLTPIECERLQTVPDNYTEGVSDTQRYKMLGNGWTVDVISHIFSYIKN